MSSQEGGSHDYEHRSNFGVRGRLPSDDRGRVGSLRTETRPTIVVKHFPIVSPGDVSASRSARQNVIESKQYEQALRTNPAFRQARMRRECGPITDPELHKSCPASFDRN
jgi:hypothetical protein